MASVERIPARRRGRRANEGKGRKGQVAKSLVAASLALAIGGSCHSSPAQDKRSDGIRFAAYLAMVEEDQLIESDTLPAPEVESDRIRLRMEDAAEVSGAEQIPPSDAAELSPERTLTLADVIASVYQAYPEVIAARQFLPEAGGRLLQAYGAYDPKLTAHSINEPLGFYSNFRHGLGLARQTWWGGYVSAGYRVGRGRYAPWYLERQTEDGGEIKVSTVQPLLQGRAIDPQRVAVFQASLQQLQTEPRFREIILLVSSEAVTLYWDWIAAGAALQAQRELLELAELRGRQFEVGVRARFYKPFDQTVNRALIAERRALVLAAEQKLMATAFKLGLYLRGDNGQPLYPNPEWLPDVFPIVQPLGEFDLNAEISGAIARRPELRILTYDRRQVQLDRRLAANNLLPRVDFITEGSQDFGQPATKSDDKGEFELIMGFTTEVPLPLSKARGKIRETNAKLGQIDQKLRLVRDKIATDLQIAYGNLEIAESIVRQTEEAFRISVEAATRIRSGFDAGYEDLIKVNLLEEKANDSEIELIKAQRDWFVAVGMLQMTLGLDPLDQAMVVSELPPSEMIGPGNLPKINVLEEGELEKI
ncbi:MAG: TolC family protein, partial [Planctomycetota bacterium]